MPKGRSTMLLLASVSGMAWFSRGFTLVDTVALLVCGLVAGAALAALAGARPKVR